MVTLLKYKIQNITHYSKYLVTLGSLLVGVSLLQRGGDWKM